MRPQDRNLTQDKEQSEPTDGFARRRERSRREIRKAAWELFSQFGVERVSIADIAQKARVSPATIYNNFEGKASLVREFVEMAVDELVSQVEEVLAHNGSYEAKVTALAGFLAGSVANGRSSPVSHNVLAPSVDLWYAPEIVEIRQDAKARMTESLLRLVEEGQAEGQIKANLSQEALGLYFGALMDIFAAPHLQHRFAADPRLVRDLGMLMMHGLEGDSCSRGLEPDL